jgi:hypothetical protein
MFNFNAATYGPVFEAVYSDRLPELGPGRPEEGMRRRLASLAPSDLFVSHIRDEAAAHCCLSGLWLWYDFLDESHRISQDVETPEGSYWHGIMHRREPDYSNAKYWFRRVGKHVIFPQLHEGAVELAARHSGDPAAQPLVQAEAWDPFRFVDLCEQIAAGCVDAEPFAREVAKLEWQLLFDHCHRQAIGR